MVRSKLNSPQTAFKLAANSAAQFLTKPREFDFEITRFGLTAHTLDEPNSSTFSPLRNKLARFPLKETRAGSPSFLTLVSTQIKNLGDLSLSSCLYQQELS